MSQALDQFLSRRDEHGIFHVSIVDDEGNSVYLRFAPSSDANIDRGSCKLFFDGDGVESIVSIEAAFKTDGAIFLMNPDDFTHLLEQIVSGRLVPLLPN